MKEIDGIKVFESVRDFCQWTMGRGSVEGLKNDAYVIICKDEDALPALVDLFCVDIAGDRRVGEMYKLEDAVFIARAFNDARLK
jgi:hypothetical protein